MKELKISGLFLDVRPEGWWACSQGATVISHDGDLKAPCPMMFNVVTQTGEFRVASKSASPGDIYVWSAGAGWTATGDDSPGVQGHGWFPDGRLAILRGGSGQESMGLRYYDPTAPAGSNLDIFEDTPGWVTGSPTYTSATPLASALGVRRLFEWTDLGGGVYVGQGEIGGTVIQHPAFGHRLLKDGDSRFVKGHRGGSTLAIAVSRLQSGDAFGFWLEESEIAILPVYGQSEPAPPPPVKPPPIIVNPPDPKPVAPNVSDVVNKVAAENSSLLEINTYESCFALIVKVLSRLEELAFLSKDSESAKTYYGWGFVGKTAGESGFSPASWEPKDFSGHRIVGFSHDCIKHRDGQVVDILSNASANSDPRPEIHGRAGAQYVEVEPAHWRENNPYIPFTAFTGSVPVPVPTPTPKPPDPVPPPVQNQELFIINERLNKLEARATEIEREQKLFDQDLLNIMQAVGTLAVKVGDLSAGQFDIVADPNGPITLRTSKDYGHAHTIRVRLVKK